MNENPGNKLAPVDPKDRRPLTRKVHAPHGDRTGSSGENEESMKISGLSPEMDSKLRSLRRMLDMLLDGDMAWNRGKPADPDPVYGAIYDMMIGGFGIADLNGIRSRRAEFLFQLHRLIGDDLAKKQVSPNIVALPALPGLDQWPNTVVHHLGEHVSEAYTFDRDLSIQHPAAPTNGAVEPTEAPERVETAEEGLERFWKEQIRIDRSKALDMVWSAAVSEEAFRAGYKAGRKE